MIGQPDVVRTLTLRVCGYPEYIPCQISDLAEALLPRVVRFGDYDLFLHGLDEEELVDEYFPFLYDDESHSPPRGSMVPLRLYVPGSAVDSYGKEWDLVGWEQGFISFVVRPLPNKRVRTSIEAACFHTAALPIFNSIVEGLLAEYPEGKVQAPPQHSGASIDGRFATSLSAITPDDTGDTGDTDAQSTHAGALSEHKKRKWVKEYLLLKQRGDRITQEMFAGRTSFSHSYFREWLKKYRHEVEREIAEEAEEIEAQGSATNC